ncbi:MAG: isocitrate dehydrogenase [Candidatus Binatota bacterium]|nr:isocitrate dehydrogenase [Candidatus Binatota bacterium]
MSAAAHRVVLIPGDSVGPEIADATVLVVEASGARIEWQEALFGMRAMVSYGTPLPQESLETVRRIGIALKGRLLSAPGSAVLNPNVMLRRALGLFAQIRPVRSLPWSRYPDLDLVVVRETTEGEYAGLEHRVVPGVVESIKVVTQAACARIGAFAFEHARASGRKKVTAVHKANIMKLSDGLFLEAVREVARAHSDVAYEEMIVDNAAMRLVLDPYRFDVLVMENFYGDLIADLCAGLAGGIAAARAASLGDGMAVFEAVHGEAPELVGKNRADPLTLLGSAVLMLQHLGEHDAAVRIERAVDRVLRDGKTLTHDLGGTARTVEMAQAIAAAMR